LSNAKKGEGRSLNAVVRTFGVKNLDISKFMICLHERGKLSQCGHFEDKEGGGQFLAILCGRLLWTASNHEI